MTDASSTSMLLSRRSSISASLGSRSGVTEAARACPRDPGAGGRELRIRPSVLQDGSEVPARCRKWTGSQRKPGT
jgi:hypothetical protein